jgi:uncharacterized protein YbjT (DUF2867 family)
MRVLVVGVNGLIGSAVAARLAAQGHEVVGVTRRRRRRPNLLITTEVTIDVARAVDPAEWLAHLRGIDAVVNCAGVLQDSPRDSAAGVHRDGIAALFRACERTGVRRVVHLSALGVDRHASTAFSRTKLAGDELLMSCDLDWIILRPSLVIGRPAYGASALIRGLAALPFMPLVPDTGVLQIVHLDDVVDAVVFFLRPDAPTRRAIEIAGPRRWQFEDVVRLFRKWLRFAPARSFRVPHWTSSAMFYLGDTVSLLGWRPPMRSTARAEIARGLIGDASEWVRLTGIKPRDIETALAAEPASVQERWFAWLYLLKPVVFALLSLFWIVTGLTSLGSGFGIGKHLMEEAGAGEFAGWSVIVGALLDIAIGLGIVIRPLARVALFAALGGSLFYAVGSTILLPQLWADPLDAFLKIGPVIALNLVALAILDDR